MSPKIYGQYFQKRTTKKLAKSEYLWCYQNLLNHTSLCRKLKPITTNSAYRLLSAEIKDKSITRWSVHTAYFKRLVVFVELKLPSSHICHLSSRLKSCLCCNFVFILESSGQSRKIMTLHWDTGILFTIGSINTDIFNYGVHLLKHSFKREVQ